MCWPNGERRFALTAAVAAATVAICHFETRLTPVLRSHYQRHADIEQSERTHRVIHRRTQEYCRWFSITVLYTT